MIAALHGNTLMGKVNVVRVRTRRFVRPLCVATVGDRTHVGVVWEHGNVESGIYEIGYMFPLVERAFDGRRQ